MLPLLEQEKARHGARKARPPSLIPDPLPRADCADPRQEASIRGFVAKAMQTLLSSGVPGERRYLRANEEVAWELRQHPPVKVTVSSDRVKAFLFKQAALDHSCLGVFGWATDFLLSVLATVRDEAKQVARLAVNMDKTRLLATP